MKTVNNPQNLLHSIRDAFRTQQNTERAHKQATYMKSQIPYWGLPTPLARSITKSIAQAYIPKNAQEYHDTIIYLINHATHREEWHAAIDYARLYKKYITPEQLDTYLYIIRATEWWDTTDTVSTALIGPALKKHADLKSILISLAHDKNMWIRRSTLYTQLLYKQDTDFMLLQDLINILKTESQFFIQKAIGTALRQYARTNPTWVKAYIAANKSLLPTLAIREAMRNMQITDSNQH